MEVEIWEYTVGLDHPESVLDPRTVTSSPPIASPSVVAMTRLPHVAIVLGQSTAPPWILVGTPTVPCIHLPVAALTVVEAAMHNTLLGEQLKSPDFVTFLRDMAENSRMVPIA